MPLNNKIIITIVISIILSVSFSGCLLENILGAASFSLDSYSVVDDEGFPAIALSFTCAGRVNLKTYSSNSQMIDYDFFYRDSETTLNLGEYRETVKPGEYIFKVSDRNDKSLFEKTLSFSGSDLSISSCEQYWWKDGDSYVFIGLKLKVENTGDLPAYPYYFDMIVGSQTYSGKILPTVILSGSSEFVYFTLIHEGEFDESSFQIVLKNSNNDVIATSSFNFDVKSTVSTWTYRKGLDNTLKIPYAEYLHDYYLGLERIVVEDYSVFVLDCYDDSYLDFVKDKIIDSCDFGEYRFNLKSDVEKINYVTSFVQESLEYLSDSEGNSSFEYPRYPVETLFNGVGGGDCEDLSILAASLIEKLGYQVALLRLPEHMAVGVKLDKDEISKSFYTQDYYYLETTKDIDCGTVPPDFSNPSELYVYPILKTSFVTHNWKDDVITVFSKTEQGDFVKAIALIDNLGNETAENVEFKGVFYTDAELLLTSESTNISQIEPYDRKKAILSVELPSEADSWFETRIIIDGVTVDTQKSKNTFG